MGGINQTPSDAVVELERLFNSATSELASAVDGYLRTGKAPTRAQRKAFCYPELHVEWSTRRPPPPPNRRAYGKFQAPGSYVTTITQPAYFRSYLLEQLEPLVSEYRAAITVRTSQQQIPYPYVFDPASDAAGKEISGADLARHFPTPDLAAVGDEIADGSWQGDASGARPLAMFDGARTDYSLRRLVHYTGSDWRNTQRWILLTNYHRYVDRFVQWARGQVADADGYEKLILPGGLAIDPDTSPQDADSRVASCPWHRFQMPAYHLVAPDGQGVTLINIGVGPSNAKNITDHLAVLRPECWLMVGHCGGLRQTQRIGDYVLAHAYLRKDRILDTAVPLEVPIPALAEVQIALQDAACEITGDRGDTLKDRLRTGTVVTYDDRNWELRFSQERQRINISRAIAVDMESGTIATQGFRFRIPYGTLLCVSDKPLHGEIKLPGAANAFYESAVGQHLEIGLKTLDLLRARRETLHSRKLRSFDEPPFR